MKLGILMDPLSHIKPYKDSTVAMIECANRMGWSVAFFTLDDLYCEKGKPHARVTEITVRDPLSKQWAETKVLGVYPLVIFDLILMRKDPPFNLEYIYATYMLELAEREGVFVVNKPQSLRDANEKFFGFYFSQCTPHTLVSRDIERLKSFWVKHQQVIFKPLDGMGGESVFYVDEKGLNLSVILETLTRQNASMIVAQRYIPEVRTHGDKRILIIDGEPIPYALQRMAAEGELRANLAAGGRGEVVTLTERDYWICEQIAPTLKAMGLYFVGIDVIGDYLTEINVTSPTCIREINEGSGLDIAQQYLKRLTALLQMKKESRQ